MFLEKIDDPKYLKQLNIDELYILAAEIREALFNRLTKIGGHLGSNFGIVELTIALHYVFESPIDKIIFDVSHQSYPHKMLTGRAYGYLDENRFNEVSGYTDPIESPHDHFAIGHTSTSISLATGMAKGRDLLGSKGNIIAVIGDGSLSGGEAFEGLDTAGEMNTNLIIVVNDNEQSIAEVHGGIYNSLSLLRDSNGKSKNNMFRCMNLDYCYLDEGHDIKKLIDLFTELKDIDHPIVAHIHTQKGRGYAPAVNDKEMWHWCQPFDKAVEGDAERQEFRNDDSVNYQELTSNLILDMMEKDQSVVFATAAIPAAVGFDKEKRLLAGDQFIDVGIAEEQGIAMCSGIAKAGAKPIFATNATFIQRTYDQVMQDVCMNKSPVTILLFYASIFGLTDVGHSGIYAVPMLTNIPELIYLSPVCADEYEAMLRWSVKQCDNPVCIAVPSMDYKEYDYGIDSNYDMDNNTYKVCEEGKDVAIIAVGDMFWLGKKTALSYEKATGEKATLINPRFISVTDRNCLDNLKDEHRLVVTIEGNSIDGGFGQKISSYYGESEIHVINYGLKKGFYDRYEPSTLLLENGMTPKRIVKKILSVLN